MPSQYKVQQFDWGFRTYNTETEQPVDGAIAEFDVTEAQAEIIKQSGSTIEINGNTLVVKAPEQDPLQPVIDEQAAQREIQVQQEVEAYQAWLSTPEGKTAARYLYYQQHGEWPIEDNA